MIRQDARLPDVLRLRLATSSWWRTDHGTSNSIIQAQTKRDGSRNSEVSGVGYGAHGWTGSADLEANTLSGRRQHPAPELTRAQSVTEFGLHAASRHMRR